MSEITISSRAYAKMLLHCMKHLNSDCYGALIGVKKEEKVEIMDCFALFHERVFSPQVELAFKFV